MRNRLSSRAFLATAGVLWLAAIACGFAVMVRDQASVGAAASAPSRWPADCELSRAPGKPTLLVFAHPKCPCTRATIGELDRIAARCVDRLQMVVFFLSLPELGDAWTHGSSWESAAAIPGVEVLTDRNGERAKSFGVTTSGQTLLYDAAGELVFQGGITAARGHAGDNLGEDAVIARALGREAGCDATPVFGCRLY